MMSWTLWLVISFISLTSNLMLTHGIDVTIKENAAINTKISLNLKPNEKATFKVAPNEFSLHTNGTLTLKVGLDYENKKIYTYDIEINDGSGKPKNDKLRVLVQDINDETPVIVRPFKATGPYPNGLPENATAVLYKQERTMDGTQVYCVTATDPDTTANLTYDFFPPLESSISKNFKIVPKLGCIVRKGYSDLPTDKTKYEFRVRVTDQNSEVADKTHAYVTVTVYLKYRKPQIAADPYYIEFPELLGANKDIGRVNAIGLNDVFAPMKWTWTYDQLRSFDNPWPFRLNEKTGMLTVLKSFAFRRQCRYVWHATVHVTQQTNGTSYRTSAKLSIKLTDTNDHRPYFEESVYFSKKAFNETMTDNDTVLVEVDAIDPDEASLKNLKYELSGSGHDIFKITTNKTTGVGEVRLVGRMDYDKLGAESAYKLKVTVSDGVPVKPASVPTASVIIYVKNENDERPVFSSSLNSSAQVSRSATGNVIFQAHAFDPDGSGVTYYFRDSSNKLVSRMNNFDIDPSSGVVTYARKAPGTVTERDLVIIAKDDGFCSPKACLKGPELTSEPLKLRVMFLDRNTQAPKFVACPANQILEIEENAKAGSRVMEVNATDDDLGNDGVVEYQLVPTLFTRKPEDYVKIDRKNGTLTLARTFDRESQTEHFNTFWEVWITVLAHDLGANQLKSYCTMRIKVKDVNDNLPEFDESTYVTGIKKKSYSIGEEVIEVFAYDLDEFNTQSSTVQYAISSNPGNTFRIEASGKIRFNKNVGAASLPSLYTLTVTAENPTKVYNTDGTPSSKQRSTATVKIYVTTEDKKLPPVVTHTFNGDSMKENETESYVSVEGTVSVPGGKINEITVQILRGSYLETNKKGYFRHDLKDSNYKFLKYAAIDASIIGRVHYRGRFSRSGVTYSEGEDVYRDVRHTVKIVDVNNKIPNFILFSVDQANSRISIPEATNFSVTPVATIFAADNDIVEVNRKVTYELVDTTKRFQIRGDKLYTNVLFDYETEKGPIYLSVIAKDGTESSLTGSHGHPNTAKISIRVMITDINDNPPYFDQSAYSVAVPENQEPGKSFFQLKASDVDISSKETLTYHTTDKNVPFGIDAKTGNVYPTKPLDYDGGQKGYQLKCYVFDGRHKNFTQLNITITDVNDTPPKFSDAINGVIKTPELNVGERPNPWIQINITDSDSDLATTTITASGKWTTSPHQFFGTSVVSNRKHLIVEKAIEDPRRHLSPRDYYRFTLEASDGSLKSYAQVHVKVINGSYKYKPCFDMGSLHGYQVVGSKAVTTLKLDNAVTGKTATFSLYSPNSKFAVASDGTVTSVSAPTAADTGSLYAFKVNVTVDGVTSVGMVIVTVIPKSEKVPECKANPYSAVLYDNKRQGETFYAIVPKEVGPAQRRKLVYTFDANPNDVFGIRTLTELDAGGLYLKKPPAAGSIRVKIAINGTTSSVVCTVNVKLEDGNGNAPTLTPRPPNYSVKETKGNVQLLGAPVKLTTVTVTDRDTADVDFTIRLAGFQYNGSTNQTNPGIGLLQKSKTEADLLLLKSLDREKLTTGSGSAVVKIVVTARDHRWKYRTGTTTFELTVTDEKEVPVLSTTQNPYVNNRKAGSPVIPTAFTVSPSSTYKFKKDSSSPIWTGSNQPFTLTSNGTSFSLRVARDLTNDKDEVKLVPVVVTDASDKVLTTVTMTVGLRTGQLQNTNKAITATVSFGWAWYWTPSLTPVSLGSVYGANLYGDDAKGVVYSWESNNFPNYFILNTSTGIMFINSSVPSGNYSVKAKVQRGSSSATASVDIHVIALGTDALNNIGTIRLNDMTITQLMQRRKKAGSTGTSATSYEPSILEQMRQKIAQLLPTTVSKVHIVTLTESKPRAVNLFVSASGSPYFSAAKLNILLALNKAELEKIPGVKISGSSVDKCAEVPEKCPDGCVNKVQVDQASARVSLQTTASFVGVHLHVEAACECGAKTSVAPASVCGLYSCLNGGNCSVTPGTVTLNCTCPAGYDGPQCQKLDVNFDTNGGYVLTDPVGSCSQLHISFHFVTQQANALLLYTGPFTNTQTGKNYMAVELKSGSPEIEIRIGATPITAKLTQTTNFADGKWHRMDIWYKKGELEFMVDRCANVQPTTNDGVSVPDRKACYKKSPIVTPSSVTSPAALRLNVGTFPLQVGGCISTNLTKKFQKGVNGGIRLLRVNGELRNLVADKRAYVKNANSNTAMTRKCYDTSNNPLCGANAICRSGITEDRLCECKPGYRKDTSGKCSVQTKVMDYTKTLPSFTYWDLKKTPTDKVKTRASIRFRTRKTTGTILYLIGNSYHRNQSLEIRLLNSQVQLVVNIGDYSFDQITVPSTNVSDGAWHTIEISRVLNSYEVLLDGGGNRGSYVYYQANMNSKYNYLTLMDKILSGVRLKWGVPSEFRYDYWYSDLNNSCITDARFEGQWMPMTASDNAKATGVAIVQTEANRRNGCPNDNSCPSPDTCKLPLVCLVSIWRPLTRPSCSCKMGYVFYMNRCLLGALCSPNPCQRGYCIIDLTKADKYYCNCPSGYTGKHCGEFVGAAAASFTSAIIGLIVGLILLILIVLLLFFCWKRYRRHDDKLLDYPDEDIRENVVCYDEEGAGEEDQDGYDLTHLRKPISNDIQPAFVRPLKATPRNNSDLGNFLDGRLQTAENDPQGPPQDYSLDYGYEGQGSVVDDLSSLGSGTSDGSQQYDHLNSLGPKFRPLSDLYNNTNRAV